jgi:hypothetical protein
MDGVISHTKDLMSFVLPLAAELKQCLLVHMKPPNQKIEHFISIVENYLIEGCIGLLLLLYLAMEEWLLLHH